MRSPMSQVIITRPTSNSRVLNVITKDVRAPKIKFRAMPASRRVEIEVWPLEVAIAKTITKVSNENKIAKKGRAKRDLAAKPK